MHGNSMESIPMARKEPKTWSIPSQDWPISASEAADALTRAQEIEDNKDLHKAAVATLKKKKKAIDKVL